MNILPLRNSNIKETREDIDRSGFGKSVGFLVFRGLSAPLALLVFLAFRA
jgi:hypothetical protein